MIGAAPVCPRGRAWDVAAWAKSRRPVAREWRGPTARFCPTLRSLPVLPPDAERFLRRPVGDREQHRFFRGMVRITLPGRHHEDVVLAPLQHFVFDFGRARSFDT